MTGDNRRPASASCHLLDRFERRTRIAYVISTCRTRKAARQHPIGGSLAEAVQLGLAMRSDRRSGQLGLACLPDR